MIVGRMYCSDDSLDKFYFYCIYDNNNSFTGIRISLWEDGMITLDKKSFLDTDIFGEEELYGLSSNKSCIMDMFEHEAKE